MLASGVEKPQETVSFPIFLCCALLLGCCNASALDRFVSLSGGHVPPFTNWPGAATNIQAAIDSSSAGDLISVTNGIYFTGGKVMAGDLTNRVALDKPATVRSVNGPTATVIQGLWDAGEPGPRAVRCAWLTNGATLSGFTLRCGGTRPSTDPNSTNTSGGGAYCLGSNAVVSNCIIIGNTAGNNGGGTFGGNLKNCAILFNYARGFGGGGAYSAILNNCTVVANLATVDGGGAYSCKVTNSILYFNNLVNFPFSTANYSSSTLRSCCSTPLPAGTGNTNSDPQLVENIHLAASSPCRGAGFSAAASGTDIDGQTWSNAPSIGCDEWHAEAAIAVQPLVLPGSRFGGASLTLDSIGQPPISYYWDRDGAPIEDGGQYSGSHSASLLVRPFGPEDAGLYRVVVSNAFGMATSQVAQVNVHCVDAGGASPVPPYSSWATAATNIQDAVDAATTGGMVVVTNGLYTTGGNVMAGDLTNRVALTRPITVLSANGPDYTVIEGKWDPATTNGPGAVRCVALSWGSSVGGFTLRNGATRSSGANAVLYGGGTWFATALPPSSGVVAYSTVAYCILSNNASPFGGGANGTTLVGCTITRNRATVSGGGAYDCILKNCLLTANSAGFTGGGSHHGKLKNCTITGNSGGAGGGSYQGALTNSIAYFNTPDNASGSSLSNCCTAQLGLGPGNISVDPQLVDGGHLSVNSPCRGIGAAAFVSGTDIDGEPWANPPSIGCDEVVESGLTGALAVALSAPWTTVAAGKGVLPLTGQVTGHAGRLEWSFGDGPVATNLSSLTSHTWTNVGEYTVALTAFNTDNPAGVSTNLLVHVVPLSQPLLAAAGFSGATTFNLQFPGQEGVTYVVEQATNLATPVVWQTLSTLSGTGGILQVTDTQATNRARFYRARIP